MCVQGQRTAYHQPALLSDCAVFIYVGFNFNFRFCISFPTFSHSFGWPVALSLIGDYMCSLNWMKSSFRFCACCIFLFLRNLTQTAVQWDWISFNSLLIRSHHITSHHIASHRKCQCECGRKTKRRRNIPKFFRNEKKKRFVNSYRHKRLRWNEIYYFSRAEKLHSGCVYCVISWTMHNLSNLQCICFFFLFQFFFFVSCRNNSQLLDFSGTHTYTHTHTRDSITKQVHIVFSALQILLFSLSLSFYLFTCNFTYWCSFVDVDTCVCRSFEIICRYFLCYVLCYSVQCTMLYTPYALSKVLHFGWHSWFVVALACKVEKRKKVEKKMKIGKRAVNAYCVGYDVIMEREHEMEKRETTSYIITIAEQ